MLVGCELRGGNLCTTLPTMNNSTRKGQGVNTLEWIETQISQHKEAIKVLEADRQVLRGVARMASATDRVTTSDNGHAGSTETARTVRRRGRPAKVPASISSGAGEAPRASRGRLHGS